MEGWSRVSDGRSGFDVGEAGVGLAAAGRSAKVAGDAAICRTNKNSVGFIKSNKQLCPNKLYNSCQ